MQTFLIDFIPVILFLIAFKIYGIYTATLVGIIATAIQVVLTRFIRHAYDKQQLITLAVFTVFGSLTLYFHNPIFIKWKPSIIFWIFGLVFIGSQLFTQKNIAQRMLEKLIEDPSTHIPLSVWKKLNTFWAAFFIGLGCLNLYVAYTFSTDSWVNFKVYGVMSLLFIVTIGQALYLSRYMTHTNRAKQ